jgi:alanine dehydrogenase
MVLTGRYLIENPIFEKARVSFEMTMGIRNAPSSLVRNVSPDFKDVTMQYEIFSEVSCSETNATKGLWPKTKI